MFNLMKRTDRNHFYLWVMRGINLFCCVLSESMRGNSLKLHQMRVRLDIRKKIVKNWKRLPRDVVDSPFEVILKIHGYVTLKDMVKWWICRCWVNG